MTHMNHVADEYAKMTQNEVRLLKNGELKRGTRQQKAAFLLSIEKDYESLSKEEEGPSEDEASSNI